jgi:HK97 gp10 family phage protein
MPAAHTHLKWYGDTVQKEMESRAETMLLEAGDAMADEIRRTISIPTASAGPSQPDEPPHMDHGDLVKSVYSRLVGRLTVSVGVSDPKALFLEIGTRHMAARPFIRRALYWLIQNFGSRFTFKPKK